jgi:hypothetical protein
LEAFVELNNSGAEPDTPKAVIRIKAYLRAVKWDIQQNSGAEPETLRLRSEWAALTEVK